jgi:hypothetical protein
LKLLLGHSQMGQGRWQIEPASPQEFQQHMAELMHPQTRQSPIIVCIPASQHKRAEGAWQKQLDQHIGIYNQHQD